MRTMLLSAVCALGFAVAGLSGASAVPVAGLDGAANYSPIEQVQYYYHRHHHHRVCRVVTRCHVGYHGRRICRTARVCRY